MVETHVRAIVHAFLLLFFIFWLRKRVYEQSYTRFVCFFFFFLYFGFGNACTSNRTRVSSFIFIFWLRKRMYDCSYMLFLFFFFSFFFLASETCVRAIVHTFLVFFLFFFPRNTCTIACTRVF